LATAVLLLSRCPLLGDAAWASVDAMRDVVKFSVAVLPDHDLRVSRAADDPVRTAPDAI
jgi:hypothetical protein